jgi:hypothetical protein
MYTVAMKGVRWLNPFKEGYLRGTAFESRSDTLTVCRGFPHLPHASIGTEIGYNYPCT